MILAFIEHDRGVVDPSTLQALACAREVSRATGEPIHAVVIAAGGSAFQDLLQRHGVAHIYAVEQSSLGAYASAAWGRCLTQLIHAHRPSVVMAASTDRGNEVLAWAAAIAGVPLAANCLQVKPGTVFEVTRFRFGGSLLEEALLHGEPPLVTIAPYVFESAEVDAPATATVETVAPAIGEKDLRARVTSREETQSAGVSLQTAPVIVSGGRGVGSAEGFRVLEELAALLGGAVGGSRVATNNGWRPHSDQVGLTGNRVAPDLYVACGISGAIQHQVGCKGAKRILVINKDRDAPFLRRADYGVIGDLHEVLPALIAEIRKRKSSTGHA